MEVHLMFNERALASGRWLILERTLEFHQCFSRTSGLVVMSGKTLPDPKTVLHENSQTTYAAKGNDFRSAVVVVKLQTSAKWQECSKVPRIFCVLLWSFPSQQIRQELHASPHIEHFPILSYPYISIYGYVLGIYGYVG